MEIGIGLDATLNLSFEEQAILSQEAARLGYASVWTPEGTGQDSFQVCAQRWAASCQIVPNGLLTGIAVSPVMYRTPVAFAMSGGTLSNLTGGQFIMGIGAGNVYHLRSRQTLGMPRVSTLSMMRDYLTSIRSLLTGQVTTYEGPVVTLRRVRLDIDPPPLTPVYLGALGPEMLRLAGELADGVALNWCTPGQVLWSMDRIAEGAARVGRNPAEVRIVGYIRVCVDNDLDLARQSMARAVMPYALGSRVPSDRDKAFGYRAHFERMGFSSILSKLDSMRQQGSSNVQLAAAFPSELLGRIGYYGPASGAAEAFRRLSQGLDVAIVRVVSARPGLNNVLHTMTACRPELLS